MRTTNEKLLSYLEIYFHSIFLIHIRGKFQMNFNSLILDQNIQVEQIIQNVNHFNERFIKHTYERFIKHTHERFIKHVF